MIMKMMFLLFFDNVASDRELMRIIPERLDYMWFLGYGLGDIIPNHRVLSKTQVRIRIAMDEPPEDWSEQKAEETGYATDADIGAMFGGLVE